MRVYGCLLGFWVNFHGSLEFRRFLAMLNRPMSAVLALRHQSHHWEDKPKEPAAVKDGKAGFVEGCLR